MEKVFVFKQMKSKGNGELKKRNVEEKSRFRSTKGIGILLFMRVIIRESNLSFSDCTTVIPKRGFEGI